MILPAEVIQHVHLCWIRQLTWVHVNKIHKPKSLSEFFENFRQPFNVTCGCNLSHWPLARPLAITPCPPGNEALLAPPSHTSQPSGTSRPGLHSRSGLMSLFQKRPCIRTGTFQFMAISFFHAFNSYTHRMKKRLGQLN